MALIVRMARRGAWASGAPGVEHRKDFERRKVDEDGLSVYEVSVEQGTELREVVAGIACARGKLEHVDVLFLPSKFVTSFGGLTTTPGDTPVPAANELHRSLDWDEPDLHKLADAAKAAGYEVCRIPRAAVVAAVAATDARLVVGAAAQALVGAARAAQAKG